eukprot:TRINITY_DN364_c0_g1_i4.p1 TRINITY_DN364_c0_g1~~TRINITY_DN364_c0_g1_i4.p1  ORF type:complete len:215 (+),score=9.52 TRINITY_DN364_c0_g1_i4:181-825(+)
MSPRHPGSQMPGQSRSSAPKAIAFGRVFKVLPGINHRVKQPAAPTTETNAPDAPAAALAMTPRPPSAPRLPRGCVTMRPADYLPGGRATKRTKPEQPRTPVQRRRIALHQAPLLSMVPADYTSGPSLRQEMQRHESCQLDPPTFGSIAAAVVFGIKSKQKLLSMRPGDYVPESPKYHTPRRSVHSCRSPAWDRKRQAVKNTFDSHRVELARRCS